MKEMMKHKMMNRFQRRNSSSSSSLDFKSGEKLDFKFSSLQALQVPAGWDKLTLSLISVETDKTVTKTGKASVYNGNCRWTESLSESIWISQDDSSKELQQCLYKLLISKGSTRSGILGEVTVNLSNYFSSETSLPVALPLKKCDHGTILQVAIQCLNPRANLRSRDSNSVAEDVNSEYSDLDNMSDAPHGTNNNNVGSSSTDSVVDASPARALGSRATSSSTVRSYHSFDSMDDSFGRESSLSNLSEVTVDLIGRPESTGLVNVYDSPKSNRSGKNLLNQRQDSGKVSHIPASPLRTFHSSSEFVLEADASTPEELRAEARSWERNARKLKVDLDLSRNETINQTKHLENVTMELSALQKECNGLKDEIKHLKILLGESTVKERDAVNLKNQVQDNKDIQVKLEEEIKFQKNLNDDLALQLSKTQESNLELVSVLQELEETIEKQRMEIENRESSEQQPAGDSWNSDVELQKHQDSQKRLEDMILNLEKTLEEKSQTLVDNESKWRQELHLKDEEINNLKAKLSEAVAVPVLNETESRTIETRDLDEEVKALREKVLELERECNELTDENLDLLYKLKESNNDLSTDGSSITSSVQLSDLKLVNNRLEESLKVMQKELDDTKDSHISGTKILEKKILELETHNHELEMQLAELEEENLHLSGRIAGLEPQLRYLTDDRESSRLEAEHSESQVLKLQSEIEKLESELESTKVDMRQKVQDMQKRWLEAQEECEYLRKANPKLESTTENLMEECSLLQKSNSELRQQRLELNNRCTILETKLKESQDNFMKLSKSSEDLEEKLSSMIDGIELKEKTFNSEIDGLRQKFKEHAEKCVTDENVLNKMYSDKVVEVENLKQEVEHLNRQMSATHDERDKMASEAVLEMHVLRAEKDKLVNSIAEVEEKLRLSEKKVDTIEVEYEKKILDLTVEIDSSKQNHKELVTNHEKLMELLENTRSSEEKLKNTIGELSANVKSYEYKTVQVTEENSSLKDQLQRLPVLQDEIVALKNSLNDMKFENERLSASLQMVSDDYQQLKEENTSLVEKLSNMQKSMIELEDHKRNKIVLEEKILRLQGDLTAREALGAQDAELKNEVGRLKRSNSQLQWKINRLQEEKDEYLKKTEALEEQKQDSKPNEHEAIYSDSTSVHEETKITEDAEVNKVDSRIQSLEVALAEALEANEMYKLQLKSLVSEGPARESDVNKEHKNEVSSLERELSELQERYLHMSLKYAEVEAQREELVLKLKAVGPGRSWFS
ncbi:putative NT-type C2 domain-containing protein [Helianthus anomalus]